MRRRMIFSLITIACFCGLFWVLAQAVFAETMQYEVGVNFTFAPTLSIALTDDDIAIGNLVPGNFASSNSVGVTVKTNNIYGCQLSAMVGDSSHNTRDLVHTNGNLAFTSLDIDASVNIIETDSTWGYSIDGGTTYSGLPLYSDTNNPLILMDTDGASEYYSSFKIGAKAAQNQAAGSYSNVVSFLAVVKPEPILTMQNVTSADLDGLADGTVITMDDERTWYSYESTLLDLGGGEKVLWMNTDLKIPSGTTLTPADSNVSSNFTLSDTTWTSSAQWFYCKQNMAFYGGNYYYNWYAATANPYDPTVDGIDPTTNCATSARDEMSLGDICPKGWRLPTAGDVYKFMDSATIGNTIGSSSNGKGIFLSGGTGNSSYGYWWTSSRGTDTNAYHLGGNSSTGYSGASLSNIEKRDGTVIRCMFEIDDPSGSYSVIGDMQNVDSNFLANYSYGDVFRLRDSRTDEKYAISVVNLGNKKSLWMNTNLKLPGGTTLTPADSNVSSNFTLSNAVWEPKRYYCQQIMLNAGGEYYYNRYAALANPYVCEDPTDYSYATQQNDRYSLGDICPKGWRIPVDNDRNNLMNNPTVVSTLKKTGRVEDRGVASAGGNGFWHISTWQGNFYSHQLVWDGTSVHVGGNSSAGGYSVRCIYDGNTSLLAN